MSLKPCVFIDLKTGKRYNYDEFRQFLYENPKFWEEKRGAVEREPGLMKKAALVDMPNNYEVSALQVLMSKGITKELLFSMYGKNTGFAEYDKKQIEGEVKARKFMIRKTGPKTVDVMAELVMTYMAENSGNPDAVPNDYDYQEAASAIETAIQDYRNFAEMARRILEIAGEYDASKYEDEYVKYMMQQEETQEEAEQEETGRKALSEEEFQELERQIAEEYIKREQEDAEESEKMFGKPLSDEEYEKMRSAWDNEFAEREFTRNLTPEQKQALANLELAMLGLSNAKEAYENEVKKQARGSQQELFGSNPLGFVQNESPQALKDKLDRLKTAVDMAQAVADKALAAYQREMGMETRQGDLFGGQKPEKQITFNTNNGKELVGERIKTGNPIYDQIDLILVKDGLQYEIYELASGLKLTIEISFSAKDAIEEILNSDKLQKAASILYDKIYKNENLKQFGAAGKVTLANQSQVYTDYSNQRKEQEQAEKEKRPFVHTEEERKVLLAIADSAEKEGINKAAEMIRLFANNKQGIRFKIEKMPAERANEIVDQYRVEKIKEEARKAGLPYPSDLIESIETGKEWFKRISLSEFSNKDKARENFYKVPEEIRDMIYGAYKKAIEIYNYYGYTIPELERVIPIMHRYVSIAGQSISETERADKYDRELEVDAPRIEAINAVYEREKNKLSATKPGEIKITQEGNEYTFALNDVTGVLNFDGGIVSTVEEEGDQKLPDWAKNEAYLNNIENAGRAEGKGKGDGKTVIEAMKRKAKELGADILTLRADMGMGFTGVDSKLYQYYKSLGFVDNNPAKPNGQMYFDLRSKPDEKVERPPVTTTTGKKSRTQTIKDTKLADAAAKNAEKLKGSMDELKDAFKDLLGEMKKQGPATMNGIRTEVLEKAVKVVGIMIKVGIYKFADIIIQVQQQLGDVSDELFQAMKKAYLAYASDAEEDVFDQMDTARDIRGTLLTDIFAPADEVVEEDPFENAIRESIKNKTPLNIVAMRKLLPGISDTDIQERVESIVVKMARDIAQTTMSDAEKLNAIENIYNYQPTLAQKDSTRVKLQQYSTPLPYAFIASSFAAAKNPTLTLEPSAGNGALTIAMDPARVVANEIDQERLSNLQSQGFAEVTNQDALLPFDGTYDAVVMNPPFGSKGLRVFGTETKYNLTGLDPIMVANALDSMTNNGVAAIIVGEHNSYADDGLIESTKYRKLLNYLYHYYNVLDVINVDGKLYYKQGTTYPTRLILINGRKQTPGGIAPIRSQVSDEMIAPVTDYNTLMARVQNAKDVLLQSKLDQGIVDSGKQGQTGTGKGAGGVGGGRGAGRGAGTTTTKKEKEEAELEEGDRTGIGEDFTGETKTGETQELDETDIDIEAEKVLYKPMSKGKSVGTYQPTAMAAETRRVLNQIQEQYGDIDEFVARELGYKNIGELHKGLYAEQVDAVAMAIAQIKTGNSLIVGDMTGVGKGRIAAAMIRYGVKQGKTPIFITQDGALFSDMYRDLKGIGAEALVPFIVNTDTKSNVTETDLATDEQKLIYKHQSKPEFTKALEYLRQKGELPKQFNYVMVTYSQVNSDRFPDKRSLLNLLAPGNILIMDESHNASGTSQTGEYIGGLVQNSQGTLFLSATWAKTPENMPIYALKTSIRDTGLSNEKLIEAITTGGVALQEIISAQLAQAGQMVRRERDFQGVEMNYTYPESEEVAQTQKQQADQVIRLVRLIIAFQRSYVSPAIKSIREDKLTEGVRVDEKKKSSDMGVKNTPFASKLFNVMQQLIFSIKAEQVAEEAINELKNNRKPVIGFQNTMESFLDDMGFAMQEVIPNIDFSLTLIRGLDKTLEYTEDDAAGKKKTKTLSPEQLGSEGTAAYYRLRAEIQQAVSGITISPIDVIKTKIEKAGYKVAELTGRETVIQILPNQGAILSKRAKPDKKKMVAEFNNGNIDVLLINASAATGLSMHASEDEKVKDKRQRIMIIAQPPFDVNTFIQMLGRIDRTGQVVRGAYNIMLSSIPAEGRFQIMLKKKVASLLANTTAQQESSSVDIQVADIINKYGDQIVTEYLVENPEINMLLNDPLKIGEQEDLSKVTVQDNAATEVLKRVALLYTKEQEAFYTEISARYEALINYLNSMDENDLKVVSVPLQAETLYRQVFFEGQHTGSPFGEDAVIEVVEANVLRKPMPAEQVRKNMEKATEGVAPTKYMADKIDEVNSYYENLTNEERERITGLMEKEIVVAKEQITANENFDKDFPLASEAEAQRERAKQQAEDAIRDAYAQRMEKSLKRINDQKILVKQYLNALKIGKIVKVPMMISERDSSPLSSVGVVMNIEFGKKTKNPFAPSNITFVIAIRDGRSQIKIPLSKSLILQQIVVRSNNVEQENLDSFFDKWDKETKKLKDREIRFIMSGNILMGYGQMKGNLVSYTTKDGKSRKGILYRPGQLKLEELAGQTPITNAYDQVMNTRRDVTSTNGEVTIEYNTRDSILILVPKSTKLGGKYFNDEELLSLSDSGEFRSYGRNMQARFNGENAKQALKVLAGSKFMLTIPGDKMPPEVVAEINERMRQQGQEVASSASSIQATADAAKKEYNPVIVGLDEYTRTDNGKKMVMARYRSLSDADFTTLRRIASANNGFYSSTARGFLFEKGSDAAKFQQSAEQAMYEQSAETTQIPQSLFDRLITKIEQLIEREKNLPPGSVAYSSIVPIPPQVARAISIGALRAAKAVIMAAKAANNFTKKTMQDALAAAEQYVRNYMSDPTKFKPSQVEDMVKRVSKLIQPVNPVDVAVEVVTENSELVAEITKATDKAFEKMSALIAKEGMKQARKQAINLMKTILGGAKVPLNPNLIEKILARFPNSNTDKAMLNFIEYAVGMIQSAEKIKALQSLVDKAKTELDKSYAGAEMKARLKPLLRTIEAHKVDPDKMDILSSMLYAFIQQMAGKNYKAVSIQRLVEMLVDQGAYIDQQTKIRRRAMMQARVDRMIDSGALPAGTSVDDYEQMLIEQAEQEAQNQAAAPAAPAQQSETADLLIPEITGLMSQARDKAAISGTPFVKRMMRWTGKINLNTLTDNELKRLHNILNDYIELDDLSDLGVYAARGEAQERLSRLNTLVNKFRQYKGDVTKFSLNNLLENVSSSEEAKDTLRAELYQREEVLFGDVKKRTDDNLQALETHIIENDMDERAVRATEVFNILAQAGSQNSTWQAWREAMMINWNKYLNKKMEEQRLMSSGYTNIFEKDILAEEIRIAEQTLNILENDFDPDQHQTLATTIDRSQAELAQMVRNFYAEISEEFRQNTAAFFSKLFDPTENPMYVSLNVIDRLGKGGIDESSNPTLTDTVFEEARIDRRESRTAIERTTFTNNAVVYGTDLLANFRKRYYQTLYQAKMTEELFVMDRMIKSEQFRNLFDPQYSDRTTKVILAFMEGVVDGQRYFGYIGVSDQPMIKKLVNGNIGAVLVDLGQYAKQSIGALQIKARVSFKLTGWALKTAILPTEAQKRWLDSTTTLRERTYQSESLVSKQYAELNKFAGKTWAKKLLVKIGDAIKNTRNFMAKYTIEKADRFVSAAALFAGYANSLNKQGLIQDPSEINWDEEIKNPNYNALAAAENLSDEINVPSNQTTKAEVLRSEKKSINDFTRKEINWMLAQFDLNAYNNFRNNWRTIMDMSGTVDAKERWSAGAKVFGILANTQTYAAVKIGMDILYQQVAIAIALWALGIDFEDEDEEERKRRQNRSLATSALLGVFNLFVGKYGNIAKIIPKVAFALGFAAFYKDKEQTEENKGTLKDPNTDLFYDPTGVPVVDLAVRQMEQIGKNIKKEDDGYELARTAGMLASFVTGFATIERITAKTTKEMSESPKRKDAKLAEKTDLLGEKKFDERKTKLFKYLKEGHEDYAQTIFEKMVGPVVSENYNENYNKTFQAIMDHLQTDRVRSQMKGSDYFGALAYGLGFAGKEINVTLPEGITGNIDVLMGRGYLNEGDIRRIVQRYENQYQEDMKMIETLKEVNPILGNALEKFFKPEGPGEGSLPQSYSIMRRMKKKGSLAYDIPE